MSTVLPPLASVVRIHTAESYYFSFKLCNESCLCNKTSLFRSVSGFGDRFRALSSFLVESMLHYWRFEPIWLQTRNY